MSRRILLTAIAISYILCVLLLSGLQKEDIGVNTLKELERRNVNIHDMNNETLRQECLAQTKLGAESNTQQIGIFGDQKAVKLSMTTTSYGNIVDTQTPNTSNSMVQPHDLNGETWNLNQNEKNESTNKQLQLQQIITSTKNKENNDSENIPTLENIVNFWNKYKNNSKIYDSKIFAEVPKTSPTTEATTHSNSVLLRSSEIDYFKTILAEYLAERNTTTSKQETATGQDNNNFVSQYPEIMDNNDKTQKLTSHKLPFSINLGDQMTKVNSGNRSAVDRSQQPPLAGMIDSNNIYLNKEGSNNIVQLNKFSQRPKQELMLANVLDQNDMNTRNLIKIIASSLHKNKRESDNVPLREKKSQFIKKLNSAAAVDSRITDFGRISDIEQSARKNEQKIKDVSLFVDKLRKNNNNYVGTPKDTNNATLEDWYSKFISDNIEISPSLVSNNNEKELARESLFGDAYTLNNETTYADKTKDTQNLGYSLVREKYKSRDILQPIPYVEQDSEVFDINSLLNNNYRATERSKDILYPDFTLKVFNPEFLSNIPSPSRHNDEDNSSPFDPNLLLNINQKALYRNSQLRNDLQYTKINFNSPTNQQIKNEGTLEPNYMGNNNYKPFEGELDEPFIARKPTPENFISRFRKRVAKESYLNDEYIEAPNETTLSGNDRSIVNIGKQTDTFYDGGNFPNIIRNVQVEAPKVIPPFVENNINPNKIFEKSNAFAHKNDETVNAIPVFDNDPSRNNIKRIIKKPNVLQYNPKLGLNTVIQSDKLRLIQNSLQYINQILAMNEEVDSSSLSYIVNTTSRNTFQINKYQPAKLNVIKQRKHKIMITSNHSVTDNLKKIQNIPADFIKEMAESIKKSILKDIRKETFTSTSTKSTTSLFTTITTAKTPVTTTEITTAVTKAKEERNKKDANYIVQKILELFNELNTETVGKTWTTLKPYVLETHVSKNVYLPSEKDQPPPMPALNPYGIKPEIIQTNYSNSYKQVNINPLKNSYKDSLQPILENQTSQMVNQPPQMLTHPQKITNQSPRIMNQLQMVNQPSQLYKQPLMVNKPPQTIVLAQPPQNVNQESGPQQLLNQAPQVMNRQPKVGNQAPQNIYNYPSTFNQSPQILYEPVQLINQPPLSTNQALENIYNFPQLLNHEVEILNHRSQIVYQAPQIVKETLQTVDRSPQTLNQQQKMRNQAPQTLHKSTEIYNQPSRMLNQAPHIIKHTPQNVNRSPQMLNQPSKNMNHAQQILNHALQMKNEASQMLNDSPEILNQSPQIENHPQKMVQMRNRALQMINNYPKMMKQRQKYPNRTPQQFNQAPHVMYHSAETLDPAPQMSAPLTNAMQSQNYVTFQTNSNEIPPLGIPIDNQKRLFNQVIIVTTKRPFQKTKDLREQQVTQVWPGEKPKEKKQTHSVFNKRLRISDILKHHEFKEPSKNRSSKYRANSLCKKYDGNHREPYKQKNKQQDYGRARSQHDAVKKFHEQLERIEDWSNADQKRSRERVNTYDEVASRQQVPLTKVKQRARYDDTHFRNFLKTQEKVNDMLEALLATKKSSDQQMRSVETP